MVVLDDGAEGFDSESSTSKVVVVSNWRKANGGSS